jgi:protein-tyrosine-phosphatase
MAHALFVCLHNAGRSQMSQVLLERAAEGRHTAASAGTQPGERLHRQVFDAMASSTSTSPTAPRRHLPASSPNKLTSS